MFVKMFFILFLSISCLCNWNIFSKNGKVNKIIPKLHPEKEVLLKDESYGNTDLKKGSKFTWKEYEITDRTSLEDVKFLPDQKTGVIAAEVGKVYKTIDGGSSWTKVLDLGFPYYFYGISIINDSYIVASGFNNDVKENGGYVTISSSGGKNFTIPEKLSSNWFQFAQDFLEENGILLVEDGVFVTRNSGQVWKFNTISGSSWWGDGFTMFDKNSAVISGLDHLCFTKNLEDWKCADPISDVHDGNYFFNTSYGFVGSGWIDPTVEGWIRKTSDGGNSWSNKLVSTPYPIRDVMFYNEELGFAIGGNFFSNVGGIYLTSDGGETWSLEIDTTCEMKGISIVKNKVWIVGSSPSKSVVYSATIN